MSRWWAVGAECLKPGGVLVKAKTRRQALATLRRMLLDAEIAGGHSARAAAERLRYIPRWVEAGPLSASEAHAYELGWTLAWAVCQRVSSATLGEPAAPLADRSMAVFWLGEEITSRLEDEVADRFDVQHQAAS